MPLPCAPLPLRRRAFPPPSRAPAFLSRSFDDDAPTCGSGSSANEMRLGVGVERPDDAALLVRERVKPNAPGMPSSVGVGGAEGAGVEFGVGVEEGFGVGGAERCLSTDCRGGDGGRVDDECRAFVNIREMDAVAVEVPATGATDGGERNAGRGDVGFGGGGG